MLKGDLNVAFPGLLLDLVLLFLLLALGGKSDEVCRMLADFSLIDLGALVAVGSLAGFFFRRLGLGCDTDGAFVAVDQFLRTYGCDVIAVGAGAVLECEL